MGIICREEILKMASNKNSTKNNSIASISDLRSQSIQGIEQNRNVMQIPNFVIETNEFGNQHDDIYLREYVRRVWRNKSVVIIVTILLMILPVIYIFNLPKVYQAETKIQIDSENPAKLAPIKNNTTTYENRAYYNTQLKLLENSNLIRTVVQEKGLENNKAFLDEKFIEPGSLNPKVIQQVSLEQKNEKSDEESNNDTSAIIAEAERLQPIVLAIQESLSVQPILQSKQEVKDTRLISLKFQHPDPKIAKLVVNAIANELVKTNLESKKDTNSSELKYLNENIESLKSQIRSGEKQILQYGRRYQLPSENDNQNTVIERLAGLSRQLLEAENERKLAEARYNASLAPGALDALAETGATNITDIEAKIDDLQQKRAKLLVEVTEKFPEVQEIDKQIAVLKNAVTNKRVRNTSNYKKGLEVKYRQAVAREKSIRKSYNQQWAKTLNQNSAAINYRIIQQELDTNRKLLDEMQRREKENEMLTARAKNNIKVVEYALTPNEPVNQQRIAYLGLAFLGAFSFGIGSALVRDYFKEPKDTTNNNEKTLNAEPMTVASEMDGNVTNQTQKVGHSKPLKTIENAKAKSLVFENGNELILNEKNKSTLADVFHQLKPVLEFSPDLGEAKKLLITSSVIVEGQTTTSINIAKSLARTGASILIIDADFRDPKMHKIFGCSNERGLSNLLTEPIYDENVENLIVEVSENLSFMPSGPILKNTSKRLGSNRTKELMFWLNENFDYIIIDSPPVYFFADSSVLARNVDGVLLIAKAGDDVLQEVEQTRKFLTRAGGKIVGVVLEPNKKQNGTT